ncbi:halocarboxylic acid dehydrogenase DehI family protein [Salinisphaera orenii]|uniref:halocarboxylic acid dehydrogenase DehI family protein n=1 Tax=Salinisphaera orenii TaxID=856731 RepID=UPI000DBE6293
MDTDLEQRLARGMRLIPDLPDLGKNQVSDNMRSVYDDIERTLRVPFVNFIFRTLANFPDYFKPAWTGLAPLLRRQECERAAARLQAAAADGVAVTPLAEDTLAAGDRTAVVAFTDAIHYVLPKLLLIATALDLQATGEFAVNSMPRDDRDPLIPYGVAEGAGRLALVDPAGAVSHVQALFADIQACHGHPGVASYYRGLGHYPEFLAAAWPVVRRQVDSESYRQRKHSVLALAESTAGHELVHRLSQPVAPAPESVGAILAVFRYRLIPDLLLDVTRIKAMLDGPQAAAHSRFSAAE